MAWASIRRANSPATLACARCVSARRRRAARWPWKALPVRAHVSAFGFLSTETAAAAMPRHRRRPRGERPSLPAHRSGVDLAIHAERLAHISDRLLPLYLYLRDCLKTSWLTHLHASTAGMGMPFYRSSNPIICAHCMLCAPARHGSNAGRGIPSLGEWRPRPKDVVRPHSQARTPTKLGNKRLTMSILGPMHLNARSLIRLSAYT